VKKSRRYGGFSNRAFHPCYQAALASTFTLFAISARDWHIPRLSRACVVTAVACWDRITCDQRAHRVTRLDMYYILLQYLVGQTGCYVCKGKRNKQIKPDQNVLRPSEGGT
jgi:hypothetical protein